MTRTRHQRTPLSRSRLVAELDAWRATLNVGHRAFSALLGRSESEWAHLRRGLRQPSNTFQRAARERAHAAGGPWPVRIDAAIQEDALARVAIPT